MRICLVAIGTSGDVLPVLTLAARFQRRAHIVRFASTANFEPHCLAAGLDFYPLNGNTQDFFGGGLGIAFRELVRKPAQYKKFYRSYLSRFAQQNLRDTWAACEGFDTAICPPWMHAAPSLSEKLGRPCYGASVAPLPGVPTRCYPDPYCGKMSQDSSPRDNFRSWRASTEIALTPLDDINDWRTNVLGLAPQTSIEYLRTYRRFCPNR
jgi:UDP:flavonoid glycosyltransferase YjiC (YdhE family)